MAAGNDDALVEAVLDAIYPCHFPENTWRNDGEPFVEQSREFGREIVAIVRAHDAAELTALREDVTSLTASLAGEVNESARLLAEVERLREALTAVLPHLPIAYAATGRPNGAAERNEALQAAKSIARAALTGAAS